MDISIKDLVEIRKNLTHLTVKIILPNGKILVGNFRDLYTDELTPLFENKTINMSTMVTLIYLDTKILGQILTWIDEFPEYLENCYSTYVDADESKIPHFKAQYDELFNELENLSVQAENYLSGQGHAPNLTQTIGRIERIKILSTHPELVGKPNTFNISVLGDPGVGKSTWLKYLKSSVFITPYKATTDVEIYPMVVKTDLGNYNLKLWDIPGKHKSLAPSDSQAALIFFDLTSPITFTNAIEYYNATYKEKYPTHPVLFVGTKSDIKDIKVSNRMITSRLRTMPGVKYIPISTKSNNAVKDPIEFILCMLLDVESLEIY